MRVILLGPPGAGKGTQAAKLGAKLGVPHVSTGDILRHQVEKSTTLGKKAHEYMAAGKLVPDELVIDMVRRRLREKDAQRGYILDGFPRTLAQARALDEFAPADVVVNLYLDPEDLVKRSTGRMVCPKDDIVYHVFTNRPRQPGMCDKCGSKLIQREDDRESVVRTRIRTYDDFTDPVVQYYKEKGLLRDVYGSGLIEEIQERMLGALRR